MVVSASDQMGKAEGLQKLGAEVRRRLGASPSPREHPSISIVVLNRNGVHHLRKLLPGLAERTDYPSIELILIDNDSSDESLDYVHSFDAPFPVTVVVNRRNESFSDANNQGAELAGGDLLLFLNNDIEPFEDGWLRELVACLQWRGVGAVASTLIERDGEEHWPSGYAIQQRGQTLESPDGGVTLTSGFQDRSRDPLGATLGVDVEPLAVSGACLLVGRDTFRAVGGFTHGYLYGGEDVDLSFKLREAGFGIRCSGRSLLMHPPGSIWKTAAPATIQQWVRSNRRLFMERWGARVRREYELSRLADDDAERRAAIEALSCCVVVHRKSEGGQPALLEEWLEAVSEVLREAGRRYLVLHGGDTDDLSALEYDVAVHVNPPPGFESRTAQLSVLWAIDGSAAGLAECSAYDVVLDPPAGLGERLREAGPEAPSPVRDITTLLAEVDARARAINLPTRVA